MSRRAAPTPWRGFRSLDPVQAARSSRAHERSQRIGAEVLSRNDHVDDFRQNRVHDVRESARKADMPKHGVGVISTLHAAECAGASVGDCIKSPIER